MELGFEHSIFIAGIIGRVPGTWGGEHGVQKLGGDLHGTESHLVCALKIRHFGILRESQLLLSGAKKY